MIRDRVAVMTGIEPQDVDFTIELQLPAGARAHVERAEALRDEAARAQREAADEWRAAAVELSGEGLTVREIGKALNISHQRAQQLVKS
jgi:DNA-binding NarL/FixJ family response regulator